MEVNISALSHRYAQREVLCDITLALRPGLTMLLGPNGAGKSTFINILSGLTNKSSGVVKVCGIDLDENPKTVRGNIGVVPQEINIDPFFSPIQIMDIQAGL